MFEDDIDSKHFRHHSAKAECVSCYSQPGGGGTCYKNSSWIVCWCNKEVYINEEENSPSDYQIVKPWTCNSYNSVIIENDCDNHMIFHVLLIYFLFLCTMLKTKHTAANMMPRLDKMLKIMVTGRKIEVCFCVLLPSLGTIPTVKKKYH